MRYSNNSVQLYSYMGNDGTMTTTYGNISKSRMYLINLGASYNMASWFNISIMNRFTYNKFEYSGNINTYWDPYYRLSIRGDLWKGGAYKWSMNYISPNVGVTNIQSKKSHMFFEGQISFSQQIEKNMFISLYISNYWETHRTRIVEENSFDYYKYQKNTELGRTFLFTFEYNFGRFKDRVKSVRRAIQNTDRTKE